VRVNVPVNQETQESRTKQARRRGGEGLPGDANNDVGVFGLLYYPK
jgi:hypothetical protein